MRTVLVVCPHCQTRQLADEKALGTTVACAKCESLFTCETESEPLLWVRTAMNKGTAALFEKYVSRILFTYGVAVPVAKQDMVVEHLGEAIIEGATRTVLIEIHGTNYPAHINLFRNKKGEPSLHFKWSGDARIEAALKDLFPEAYVHYVVEGNRDFLADTIVEVGSSSTSGVFWLRRKNMVQPEKDPQRPEKLKRPKRTRLAKLSEILGD